MAWLRSKRGVTTCHDGSMDGYDIIGDIHGHATKLKALLASLGYIEVDGAYHHPTRTVIFVVDFIDRGPEQLEVLKVVRSMCDAGSAQAVMGNHELNALAFGTEYPKGSNQYLRKHTPKNIEQHGAFLNQLTAEEQDQWRAWFMSLPLILELEGLRVVHACWHQPSVDRVRALLGGATFRDEADLIEAHADGDGGGPRSLARCVETLLKGPELSLEKYGMPKFVDKGNIARNEARVKWWRSGARTLADLAVFQKDAETDSGLPYPDCSSIVADDEDCTYSYNGEIPVIYGHYWREGEPEHLEDWTPTTACVDFSVGKGGTLVAYRWSGERELTPEHYLPNGPDIVAPPQSEEGTATPPMLRR